jgi:NADPH:quinone reductase-like Zn-dependent oxidoreductase
MRAMIVEKYGNPSQLKLADIPIPTPLDNEIQIAIHYASVNPVDWKILAGHFDAYPHEFPFILGWDTAGKISKVGKKMCAILKSVMKSIVMPANLS